MHNDLAARNVVVTGDYVGKVADLGLSRRLGLCEDIESGELPWTAPSEQSQQCIKVVPVAASSHAVLHNNCGTAVAHVAMAQQLWLFFVRCPCLCSVLWAPVCIFCPCFL